MHPYRELHCVRAEPPAPRRDRELTVACAVLAAVSLVQIASGAQLVVGVIGLGTSLAGCWRGVRAQRQPSRSR